MQKFRLRDCCVPLKRLTSQFYAFFRSKNNPSRTLFSFFLVFLFLLFSNLVTAQEPRKDSGADGRLNIQPLAPGDTVPKEIWNLPLKLVRHNAKTRTVKLANYRGKIIIFDYWATWCRSCIQTVPKMHAQAADFPDDIVLLPVTHESEQHIKSFLVKTQSPQIRQLEKEFETVVAGDMLKRLIPHQTLPHVAIINREGVLELVTKPPFVNHELLNNLVEEKDYHLSTFQTTLDSTLLSSNFQDRKLYKPVYYSTLMGYLEGFINPTNEMVDEAHDIRRGFFINRPILRLFQIAMRPQFNMLMPSRRIFVLSDIASIDFLRDGYDYRRFNYSYEYVLPKSTKDDEIKRRMLRDLTDFTGYQSCIIQRELLCLVIRKAIGSDIPRRKQVDSAGVILDGVLAFKRVPVYFGHSKNGARNHLRATNLNALVHVMNNLKDSAVPFVINETDIDYRVDLDLPDKLADIPAFMETLRKQGLLVSLENRQLDVFVFSDKPIDRKKLMNASLRLGKYSYVVEKEVTDE
ncbi:TlpA family protein disulfide reductase [Sphingobacterium shayense]|uniref:TlpA family protein disulfide reductase n=1 Tax=Sphingobacterium shayense TaxID=626343 RepID=UPI0015550E39|nr:TlpA disulfide reductase family protein [Sphingobacterium shayense]NQD69983.1 TlpA family protein disulfide reductase [Sphingobacterium shayense]